MTVTDAHARAALAVWNATPGTDLVAMRAVLESFESAEIARLTLDRDHAEAMCQEWIKRAETAESSMEGADLIVADLMAEHDSETPAEPEPDPSELGAVIISLSVLPDGKLNIGTEATGNLDYATIRMMLAMASETESVRRMAEELGA